MFHCGAFYFKFTFRITPNRYIIAPGPTVVDAAQKLALAKELERAKDKLESRLSALEADIHRATLAAKVLAQRKGIRSLKRSLQ